MGFLKNVADRLKMLGQQTGSFVNENIVQPWNQGAQQAQIKINNAPTVTPNPMSFYKPAPTFTMSPTVVNPMNIQNTGLQRPSEAEYQKSKKFFTTEIPNLVRDFTSRPIAAITGSVTNPFEAKTFTPSSKFERLVFGDQPINNLKGAVEQNAPIVKQFAKKYNINLDPNVAKNIAGAGFVLGTVGNFIPGEAGALKILKTVSKDIAATEDITKIANSIRATGMVDEAAIPSLSKTLQSVNDAKVAQSAIEEAAKLSPAVKVTNAVSPNIIDDAYKSTIENGGVTINLKGNKPIEGFAYSPYKNVETVVPKVEFSTAHIDDFIEKNYNKLIESNNHLGVWEDNGQIYMDISKVGPATQKTISQAEKNGQLAVFDLKNYETIYTKLGKAQNEKVNLTNLDGGQVQGANQIGNEAGNTTIPPSATAATATSTANAIKPTATATSESINPLLKERKFVTSVQEAPNVTKKVKKNVSGTYMPKPNDALLGEAKILLQDGANIDFKNLKNIKNIDQKVTATIQHALNLQKAGDPTAAANLYNNLAEYGTELGRGVQAFSLLQKMSPEAITLSIAGKIKKFNAMGGAQIPELTAEQVNLIAEKVNKILEMPIGREKNIATGELSNIISDFIPSDNISKAVTVWKAGLLTSLRTTERNIIGNTIHTAAEMSKDVLASANDWFLSKFTGNREVTATTKGFGEGWKKGIQAMKDMYQFGFDAENAIDKFNIQRITWGKGKGEQFLKKYTDFVFRNMGAQDKPFYHAAFGRSLYDQAGAAAINAGKKGDTEFIKNLVMNPTERMLTNATKDAQVAVFQNSNKLSSFANNARNWASREDKTGIARGVIEVVAPFTGVPSAIAGQIVAYSPIGLVKGIYHDIQVVGRKVTPEMIPDLQRLASQEIGRGIIGSGLVGLGVYLTNKGLMTGRAKDAKEANQWKIEGKQENSVKIGNKWYSIGSIGPEALVALAGSKISQSKDLATAGAEIGKDFLGQTFLQGVQGPLNAINEPDRYGPSYISGQVASIVPNAIKDVAKSFDPTTREVAVPKDTIQSTKNAVMNAIPGARNQLLPSRNTLGEVIPNEQTGYKAFVDVFNTKTQKDNPVANELSRLNLVDQSATPSKLEPGQTIFSQKVKLTPAELDKLEEASGNILIPNLTAVVQDPSYKQLSDEQKKTQVGNIIEDARKQAKELMAIGTTNQPTNINATQTTTAPSTSIKSFNAGTLPNKYQIQMQLAVFDKGTSNFQDNGDTVFRRDQSGKGIVLSKDKYNSQLYSAKMTSAKNNGDLSSWMDTAEKQYTALNNQLNDPNVDELDKIQIQNDIDTLNKNIAKYKGYGGFTKGKVAPKINLVTLNRIKVRQPSTSGLKMGTVKTQKLSLKSSKPKKISAKKYTLKKPAKLKIK